MRDPATKEEFLQSLRAKQQRATLAPYWVLAALILGVGLALFAAKVYAEPIYKGTNEGVTLTLYSEPCALKEHISNLPHRITWEEKGQTYEGCFVGHPAGFVIAYFVGDKTVAVIPAQVFVKVVGA